MGTVTDKQVLSNTNNADSNVQNTLILQGAYVKGEILHIYWTHSKSTKSFKT